MTGTSPSVDPIEAIRHLGVVPVVTISDADTAVPLVGALVTGGLSAIEITLRTPAGVEAIRRTVTSGDEPLIGAGSVRSVAEAEAAIGAGARFLVSPGLDPEIVATARDADVTIIPGVATATELMRAADLGLRVVKLFPAEAAGGIANLAALASVFPEMRFMPTGGITVDNVGAYLARAEVLAVGGSWMVSSAAVQSGDWDAVRSAATRSVDLVAASR